ncbi:hypothetical protein QDS12_09205 [Nocardioides sp. CER19]|nr:hypothetical protein [Nocardioides sp. CER19]MDH2414324.1 hypothetical protein [Nocardioides sp. CER19]
MLDEVLAAFEPVAPDLAVARDRYDLDYTVSLRIDMHGFVAASSEGKPDFLVATPAIIFDPDVLSRLAALGCRFHVEQNIYSDARELRPELPDPTRGI